MRKFFLYINKQPKAVRDNYALVIASSFTLLVVMVWWVARPDSGDTTTGVMASNESTSPFSTLIKETKEKFSEVKSSLSQTEQSPENDNSQAAAVINASTSKAETLILSEEDIEIARQDMEEDSSENYLVDKSNFTEVMIATSSASTTPMSPCTELVISSTSSGAGVSCLEAINTASTTAQ